MMYLNSFMEMQQYIVTLDSNKKMQSSHERQISEVETWHGNQCKGRKRGGRGGGKRGDCRGGQNDGGKLTIYTGMYSRKEW
jgi:hypothetical protein